MKFVERTKKLREEQGLPLRKLAAALDIDSACIFVIFSLRIFNDKNLKSWL
jgi:hypothetical protein